MPTLWRADLLALLPSLHLHGRAHTHAICSHHICLPHFPLYTAVRAGSCTVRWENKTMYVITSVFGLGI
jgi:hypothetical protein